MNSDKNQFYSLNKLSDCIKILAADAIEESQSGHPGMVLGFSQIFTSLIFNHFNFNPKDPKWFNRDRLVLSAGHGSMLLYAFYYLSGYKNFSLEDIKNFRKLHSKAAGHPEYDFFEAIETTTGPLGQGLANAVGMAIAQKKYQEKLGKDISDHKVYAIIGDGCLMEGISYEACSLAGHLNLNNLIVLFDDNGISIDGKTNLTTSEDQIKRFESMGFECLSADGHDFNQINEVLEKAQSSNKPVFIAFKTIIGNGSKTKANSEKAHGSPLGPEDLEFLRQNISFQSDNKFEIPTELKTQWENAYQHSINKYNKWQSDFNNLTQDEKEFLNFKPIKFEQYLTSHQDKEATRKSSGKIIEHLINNNEKIICGSADLAGSNCLKNSTYKIINSDDFSGNFIHYGIREHAMAAIMNGLALSGFNPIGGTFFVFSDYMRPAIRLSAIMHLPIIYVMTHDSIGVGEDGPTHQPIEHLASFRAMPNINIYRPADFIEAQECYKIATENSNIPAMMVLSRQSLPQIRKNITTDNNKCEYGAYIISESSDSTNIDFTIFSSGSEVSLAIEIQKNLQENHQKSVRVCSVPCFDILIKQDKNFIENLKGNAKLTIAIETASELGWHKIIGENGLFFGMSSFGASAPANNLFNYFNLTKEQIIKTLLIS